MKTVRTILLAAGAVALLNVNNSAQACAACFGKSDSLMAQGMNAGVFVLLGVIGSVLCGAATFFVFLARRSAAVARKQEASKI